MASWLGFNRPYAATAFRTTDGAAAVLLALYCRLLKKNLNASRPSEHPGGIIGCKDNRAPIEVTLCQQYNAGACFSVAQFSFK